MKKYTLLALFAICVLACEDENTLPLEREVKFSFSTPSKSSQSGRSMSAADPVFLLVTIKDAAGEIVADRKELTLYKFGDQYLSIPFTLTTANYQLTEFLVLGEDRNVLYATPLEGSALAHLVSNPLAIDFTVSKDQITTVAPGVLEVDENANPVHYGYGQFGFNVVKTINTVFSSFIKGPSNFELTSAHIKIQGLRGSTSNDTTVLWIYETALEPKANIIALKEAAAYRVTVTKDEYQTWTKTLSLKEGSTQEILLEKSNGLRITLHYHIPQPVAGYDHLYDSAHITFTSPSAQIKQKLTMNSVSRTATGLMENLQPGDWEISISFFKVVLKSTLTDEYNGVMKVTLPGTARELISIGNTAFIEDGNAHLENTINWTKYSVYYGSFGEYWPRTHPEYIGLITRRAADPLNPYISFTALPSCNIKSISVTREYYNSAPGGGNHMNLQGSHTFEVMYGNGSGITSFTDSTSFKPLMAELKNKRWDNVEASILVELTDSRLGDVRMNVGHGWDFRPGYYSPSTGYYPSFPYP